MACNSFRPLNSEQVYLVFQWHHQKIVYICLTYKLLYSFLLVGYMQEQM